MGIVIVSGLAVGTLFTLFVLPVIYSYVASEHKPLPEFDENVKPIEGEINHLIQIIRKTNRTFEPYCAVLMRFFFVLFFHISADL